MDSYATPIQSSWKYFQSLQFLRDQFTKKSSAENVTTEEYSQILNDDDTLNFEDCVGVIKSESNSAEDVIQESHTQASTFSSSNSDHERKRKRESEQDILSHTLIKLEECMLRLLEHQTKQKVDEDMCFFESLLPHISTLTPQQKLLLRMKIQQTVYNFIYDNQPANAENSNLIS